MILLTRDQILAAPEAAAVVEDVEVPEWGGVVRVRALSGWERDRFEESLTVRRGKKIQVSMANVRARLTALCCVGEDGKSLFRESDIEALGKKSAAALDRVFGVAQRLAGIGDQDLEEMTGNFTPGPNDDSISA